MSELQGKRGGVEYTRQKLLGEAVEGSLAAKRPLADRLPQYKRFDSGFYAESKHFGEGSEYRVARRVVHELRHSAGTNRPDVRSLIANSVEHRLVAVEHGLVAAYPQR